MLSAAQQTRLIETLRSIDFINLPDAYRSGGVACVYYGTDAPLVVMSLRMEGKRNRILHYHGCLNCEEWAELLAHMQGASSEIEAPAACDPASRLPRLTEFENSLDEMLGTGAYVKIER